VCKKSKRKRKIKLKMASTMNLTARQSNQMEFGPVDLRPKSANGFSAVPIEPGVNWFAPMNTKLIQGSAPQFSNRQQRKDLLSVGLAGQEQIPKQFDWRRPESVRQLSKYKNLSDKQIASFINPVFNQGQCGSCWAVSSTMMLSDRFAIQSRKQYIKMNIQTVLACAPSSGMGGCGGGYMDKAGRYFETEGTTAECMAYNTSMKVGPECVDAKCAGPKYFVQRGTIREFRGDIDQIQSDIMNNGPVVAGYQVENSFMQYRGGVYIPGADSQVVGGHAVVIVGWGYDDRLGRGYWIVRNSWGTPWGENGYFRYAWNVNDRPGTANYAKYLENWAYSWQPKLNGQPKEEGNGGDEPEPSPEPQPEPPKPEPPKPKPPKPIPEPRRKPIKPRFQSGTKSEQAAIIGLSVATGVLLVTTLAFGILYGRKR
jgi:C1A family cysteine protease